MARPDLPPPAASRLRRPLLLTRLGMAAEAYRNDLYEHGLCGRSSELAVEDLLQFCSLVLAYFDHSIARNRRDDGLYHAYNLLLLGPGSAEISTLYPMLEGQVAALSAGAIEPAIALKAFPFPTLASPSMMVCSTTSPLPLIHSGGV